MIPDKDKPFLAEIRAITKDEQGRDVLVGLTFEETNEYLVLIEAAVTAEEKDRFLSLDDKYEAARFQVLDAENELRVTKPTMN